MKKELLIKKVEELFETCCDCSAFRECEWFSSEGNADCKADYNDGIKAVLDMIKDMKEDK